MYFEIYAAPSGISFLQHIVDGFQPIAIFSSLDESVEIFGDWDIPNFYNQNETDDLITNINLVNYYIKNLADSLISYVNSVDYYIKKQTDTLLYTNFPSLSFIADNVYDKAYLDNQFSLNADVSQLPEFVTTDYLNTNYTNSVETPTDYYKKTDIDDMLLSYSTGSYVDYNFYTKAETDTLLADKVTNIGDVSLPGMLDIGTSGYTNSRIRRNATVGGYTGYAELKAANSYDMFLNLPTSRTDGGWMYFKINNDDYIKLSGSDNKVKLKKKHW